MILWQCTYGDDWPDPSSFNCCWYCCISDVDCEVTPVCREKLLENYETQQQEIHMFMV